MPMVRPLCDSLTSANSLPVLIDAWVPSCLSLHNRVLKLGELQSSSNELLFAEA